MCRHRPQARGRKILLPFLCLSISRAVSRSCRENWQILHQSRAVWQKRWKADFLGEKTELSMLPRLGTIPDDATVTLSPRSGRSSIILRATIEGKENFKVKETSSHRLGNWYRRGTLPRKNEMRRKTKVYFLDGIWIALHGDSSRIKWLSEVKKKRKKKKHSFKIKFTLSVWELTQISSAHQTIKFLCIFLLYSY